MKVELLYDGFSSPLALSQNKLEKDIIYIGDQIGLIHKDNLLTGTLSTFLDIRYKIGQLEKDYDEKGLLDFAFAPKYPEDPRLFIFYSTQVSEGNYINYLSEITVQDIPINERNIREVILFRIHKTTGFHNGGRLAFGPDGYLYVTVGDGGPQEDPNNRAQSLDVLYGKILRLDVSSPGKYKIPKDNPFINTGNNSKPLIYAFGLRNPWSLAFSKDGKLFSADVGYNTVEKVNIIQKGGNYGWRIKEGTLKTPFGDPSDNVTNTPLIDPIFEYTHDQIRRSGVKNTKSIAIIGGYPLDDGSYVFGDLAGIIFKIKPNGKWEIIDSLIIDEYIKAFGKDLSGNIYVLTSDQVGPYGNGKIYKLLI